MTETVTFQGHEITYDQQAAIKGIIATLKHGNYVREIQSEMVDTRAKPVMITVRFSATETAPEWLWHCKIYVIGPKGAIRQEKQVY